MILITTEIQQNFLKQLLAGNRLECSLIVNKLMNEDVSVQIIYDDLLKKTLYTVGELWEYNKISVATEHLASAIVEGILNEVYLKVVSNFSIHKNVLFSCVENEFHQIGIKMISDIFEMNGWRSYFLGANVPTKEVLLYSKTIPIDLIAISFSIYFHLPDLINLIKKFRVEFPDMLILVGGQGFNHGGIEAISHFENVFYLSGIIATEKFIKKLNNE